MPVTIVKLKGETPALDQEEEAIVSAKDVDDFAKLSYKIKAKEDKLKPLKKSLGKLEVNILTAVDAVVPPGTAITLEGKTNELLVGAQGQKTIISNLPLAVELLGEDLFLQLAKITIADLQAYLTPDELKKVVKKEYSIKRRVKPEPR